MSTSNFLINSKLQKVKFFSMERIIKKWEQLIESFIELNGS